MKGPNPNDLEKQGKGLTGDAPPPCGTVDPVRDLGMPLDDVDDCIRRYVEEHAA